MIWLSQYFVNYFKFPRGINMERVCNKSKNFKEAEEWDINQQLSMTPEERQEAAKELRVRVYGRENIDVKDSIRRK